MTNRRIGSVASAAAGGGSSGGSSGAGPDGDERRAERPPMPLVAALLSALIPGLGQWYAGEKRRGRIFLLLTAAVVVPAAALLAMVFYIEGVGLAVTLSRPFFQNPDLLLVLLVVNGAMFLFRVLAIIDAFLVALRARPVPPGHPKFQGVMIAGVAVLLILAMLPHGWVAQRNLALYDLFTFDFTADPGQVTVPSTAPPTTAPTTTAGTGPVTSGASTTTSTSSTTTTTTMPDPFEGFDRINVLLMGGDSGIGRRGIRTDTMIVVSVDPRTGYTAMFSIPRNNVQLPYPDDIPAYDSNDCHCFRSLANEVYQYGLGYPGLFPGGSNTGGNAAKLVLGNLLGLEIHYFAMVDLQGFVDVIDAIGGVRITVTDRVYDDNYPHEDGTREVIDIPPGTYFMDGHLSLAYARSRQRSDDYNRMGRQRCVIEAVAEQADPVELLRKLPDLVPAIQGSVITDIPVASIPDFIDLLADADLETIPSVRFIWQAPEFEGTPTSYVAGWTSDRYPIPNVELIRRSVATAVTLPPLEAIEALNLQSIEDTCG